MIFPEPLKRGDTIAIISPATEVKGEYIDGAAALLEAEGYRVRIMPGAKGPVSGSYASELTQRTADLRDALADQQVRAILCARGGYGCNQLIDAFSPEELRADPKWIIGFSDVSALHAMMHRAGIASLHAPMAKHLTLRGADDPYSRYLLDSLRFTDEITYNVAPDPRNITATACGELRGGNLAVLNGLADTPFDMLHIAEGEQVILFIEDIAEKIYAVQRMLIRLSLGGNLRRLAGLIVGRFAEYGADRNYPSMEEMISALLKRLGVSFPVAFNFPVGHVDDNLTLIEGARASLRVTPEAVILKMSK